MTDLKRVKIVHDRHHGISTEMRADGYTTMYHSFDAQCPFCEELPTTSKAARARDITDEVTVTPPKQLR